MSKVKRLTKRQWEMVAIAVDFYREEIGNLIACDTPGALVDQAVLDRAWDTLREARWTARSI